MVNNIGILTNKTLNATLGGITSPALTSGDINILAGELGEGFLLFDSIGTVAIISNYVSDSNFRTTTYALSIDLDSILTAGY